MKNSSQKKELKVFVVDDEPSVCKSLKKTLQEDFEVAAFTSSADCLKNIEKERCDLLIADVKMPQMNGLDLLDEVKRIMPELPVLLISGYGDIPMAVKAIKKGAYDFLLKTFSQELLLSEVKRVLKKSLNGKSVSKRLRKLSKAELKILLLVLKGKSNKEIAFQLCRSRRTIDDHRRNVMRKLSVNNVVELTKVGIQLGLTEPKIK